MNGLPRAWGPAPARGRIREIPEDFGVDEVLGFEPDGRSGHLLLLVEKRGANTAWVAGALAGIAAVSPRDVGYSGHKDRDAVTRQYYSLPASAREPPNGWAACQGEGFRVLSAAPHGRKLRIGSHRANRFRLAIRGCSGEPEAIEQRLLAIGRGGVPNYFGPQRFGRDGSNLRAAHAWASGGSPPPRRTARGFALSAGRSELFNRLLALRVARGDWNQLLPGDAAMLDGRRSFFPVTTVDATLTERCAALDLHPSGPLYGRGESPVRDEALALEAGVRDAEPALCALLESQGLEQERRALRLPVRGLSWRHDGDVFELEFELSRGAFATAVLHELLEDAWDGGERGED